MSGTRDNGAPGAVPGIARGTGGPGNGTRGNGGARASGRRAGAPRVLRAGGVRIIVHPRAIIIAAVLTAIALLLGAASMTLGSIPVPLADAVRTLLGDPPDAVTQRVVTSIRLPRVVAAICAGAALGASGAVFQSISRNPLGSPDIVGFTTGAATGALFQIIVFDGGPVEVALAAVAGGMATAVIVYLLSLRDRSAGGYRLVLTGIGAGATLGGVNSLLIVRGDLENAVAAQLWLSGSLDARTWAHALPVLLGVVIVLPALALLGRPLAQLEMGDAVAAQLGVRVEAVRRSAVLLAVLLAALATAAAGPIAFIALAAPQLAARLTRAGGVPVLSGAAMGACLLVAADAVTQLLPVSFALPVGRVTGIIGGCYLLWLLARPGGGSRAGSGRGTTRHIG